MNLERSDGISEEEKNNDTPSFCYINPEIERIEGADHAELTVAILSTKLAELQQIDSSMFFSGELGDYIDNQGVHIWFIENYNAIRSLTDSANGVQSGIAKEIIQLLNDIISEKLSVNKSIDSCIITPSRKIFDILDETQYMHGFLVENFELKLRDDLENLKLHSRSEIDKILQNN